MLQKIEIKDNDDIVSSNEDYFLYFGVFNMVHKIKSDIADSLKNMSKKEIVVANFFNDNLERLPLLTSDEISSILKISKATIVRTAQKAGYQGFLHFRREINEYLYKDLTSNEKIMNTISGISEIDNYSFKKFIDEDIVNFESLKTRLNYFNIQEIIAEIVTADKIYLIGYGTSEILTLYLELQFRSIGKDVHRISKSGKYFADEITSLTNNDLLFTFGYYNTKKELLASLKYAKSIGAKTVVLTNEYERLLSKYSDYKLQIQRGSIDRVNSLVIPMELCYIISIGVYNKSCKEISEFRNKNKVIMDILNQLEQ